MVSADINRRNRGPCALAWLIPALVPGIVCVGMVAACSGGSRDPIHRTYHGCRLWAYALCAEGRGLMPFRDGDPVLEACAALDDGYDDPVWRAPLFHTGFDGITRVTATYDAEGRVTSYECDCGLDEPYAGVIEWDDDGRVVRYRGRHNEELEQERWPIYSDEGLVAYEFRFVSEDGPWETTRWDYGRDAEGHIATSSGMGAWGPFSREVLYDGDRLTTLIADGFIYRDLPYHAESTYSYDDDGRLVGWVGTIDPDLTEPVGPESAEIEWSSATEARVHLREVTIDIVIDDAGRLVRKDTHSGSTHRTMTWEWDAGGRLVEFWMYGE